MAKRRPSAYHRGQHDLICCALGLPEDPKAPGLTAYEGVCVLLTKLDMARWALRGVTTRAARDAKRLLKEPMDSEEFSVLKMY